MARDVNVSMTETGHASLQDKHVYTGSTTVPGSAFAAMHVYKTHVLSEHTQAPSPSGSSGRPWCYVEPQAGVLPRRNMDGLFLLLACVRGGGKRCGLLGLLRCDGLESVVSLMTSSLRCSLLSSARMASVELRCGRLQPVESNLLVCVASRGL